MRRHRWRRQRDNQGHVRALVPAAWATLEETEERDSPRDSTPDRPAEISRITSAFEAAVSSLTERAKVAEARADEALTTERARIDELRIQLDATRAEAQAEHEVADALRRADLERRTRGRWARIKAAWRNRG